MHFLSYNTLLYTYLLLHLLIKNIDIAKAFAFSSKTIKFFIFFILFHVSTHNVKLFRQHLISHVLTGCGGVDRPHRKWIKWKEIVCYRKKLWPSGSDLPSLPAHRVS